MAQVNFEQVVKVAEFLKSANTPQEAFNWVSDNLPAKTTTESERENAINFLFFACLHDWGFWYGDDRGWVKPMYGYVNGKRLKGADLLITVLFKAFEKDNQVFDPERLAGITIEKFLEIMSDDNGPILWPNFQHRYKMTRNYGKCFELHSHDYSNSNRSPYFLIDKANEAENPLKKFLELMTQVCGFYGDELQKRPLLLAMALSNRPERFLKVERDNECWQPIVDYHLMRLCLRLGLVEFESTFKGSQANHNIGRRWVSAINEKRIRKASFDALSSLLALSGLSMFELDYLLWQGRKYCPEETVPDCSKCIFEPVCQKNVDYFQPVFETDAY